MPRKTDQHVAGATGPDAATGSTLATGGTDALPVSAVADFEGSLDALEALVEKMEHGDMTLEESLAAYERGVGLFRRCQQALEQAELRVKLLSDPGQPASAQPFPDMPGDDA